MQKQHQRKNKKQSEGGFVAISIAIILTFAGLLVANSLSDSSLHSVLNTRTEESSAEARAYANACADSAISDVASTLLASGSGSATFSNGTCTYTLSSPTSSTRLITTTGIVGTFVRKVSATISLSATLAITQWLEVP